MNSLNENKELIGKTIYYIEVAESNTILTIKEDTIVSLSYRNETEDMYVFVKNRQFYDKLRLSQCYFSLEDAILNLKKTLHNIFTDFVFEGHNLNNIKIAGVAKEARVGEYVFSYSQKELKLTLEKIKSVSTNSGSPFVQTDNINCSAEYYINHYIGYNELCRIDNKTGKLNDEKVSILWGHPFYVSSNTDDTSALDTFLNKNISTILTVVEGNNEVSLERTRNLNLLFSDKSGNVIAKGIKLSDFATVEDLITHMKNLIA